MENQDKTGWYWLLNHSGPYNPYPVFVEKIEGNKAYYQRMEPDGENTKTYKGDTDFDKLVPIGVAILDLKTTTERITQELKKGDIIQITDQDHPWFPSLLIVDEPKSWGCVAYVIIPKSNDGSESIGLAFNRLPTGQFRAVGAAAIIEDLENV